MAFSINTNISSLQAQYYLGQTSNFQSKTINRVTSGLRIVNAGDDAAGLAIANTLRSDEAVLTQGIRNLNDGVSTLQTIDGGMSNISNLLDRARTLATQSASQTFTGDRTTLNSEFQNVLSEINRQATATGMNVGGDFAKSLQVFIGGGRGANAAAVTSTGSVTTNLSTATVDTQSLGLSGYGAGYTGTTKLDSAWFTAHGGSNAQTATFSIEGAGFSGSTGTISVTANLNGVGSVSDLAAAINSGIAQAAAAGTPQSANFKAANIQAVVDTTTNNIKFVSSTNAFTVSANNAPAGNPGGNAAEILGTTAAPAGLVQQVAGGTYQSASYAFASMVTGDSQTMSFQGTAADGSLQKVDVALSAGAGGLTMANAADQINTQLQASNLSSMKNIVAVADSATTIKFVSTTAFNVTKGQESLSTGAPDNLGFTGATGTVAATVTGTATNVDISTSASAANAVSALSSAVQALGRSQAVVGKAQNQFNYALNLASTQLTNMAASESRIRDADLASEAANLTKAQILSQAGVAALAQANSAPQGVLSLLKG